MPGFIDDSFRAEVTASKEAKERRTQKRRLKEVQYFMSPRNTRRVIKKVRRKARENFAVHGVLDVVETDHWSATEFVARDDACRRHLLAALRTEDPSVSNVEITWNYDPHLLPEESRSRIRVHFIGD